MAKKQDDSGRKADPQEPKSRADQVRAAVEQAFEATTQGTSPVRERAQELAEELVGAASRFREVIDELRPPTGDELGALRARIETLERRVADLEAEKAAGTAKPRAARPAAAKAPRATGTSSGAKGASASPGASTAKRGRAATPRKPRGGTTGS
jgi:polyhydroxyalkanoate synthesis regulator phasin